MKNIVRSPMFWLGAILLLAACKTQDNIPRTAPVDPGKEVPPTPPDEPIGALHHHLIVIPRAEQLALGIAGDPAAAEPNKSDVRATALAHFAAISQAIALMHERIEDLEKSTPTVLGSDPDCRAWQANDAHYDWTLLSCLRDVQARRYELRLEARPRDNSGADPLIVVAGEATLDLVDAHPATTPEGKLRQRLQRAGRIGYDFTRLRGLIGTGPVGSITVGYRVDDASRVINLELTNFAPTPSVMTVSGFQSFEDSATNGGRTELTVISDFVKDAGNGGMMRGSDGNVERTGLALAWDAKGLVRAIADTCTLDRQDQRCSHLHQCWAPSGVARFESYSKNAADLGWVAAECPMERYPIQSPPDPRGEPSSDDRDLPSARVPIPGPALLSRR
jgi:hypothetical protein